MPQKPSQNSQDIPPAATDDPNIPSSGLGAPPVSHGKRVEPVLPDDDEDTEKAVEQGVEDAQEDTSIKAQRTRTRSEG